MDNPKKQKKAVPVPHWEPEVLRQEWECECGSSLFFIVKDRSTNSVFLQCQDCGEQYGISGEEEIYRL